MSTVFLLQNQHKQFLSKHGEWVDGREASGLFRSVHRDEALNHMIETNARDYTLRMKILECPLNERGLPLLQDEDLPPLVIDEGETADAVAEAAVEQEQPDSPDSEPAELSGELLV